MEIETKINSNEIIKPSSPTPKSLKQYNLSFMDEISSSVMVPFVYFYSSNPQIENSTKAEHLKNSLSKTLSTFYPLAGRLVGNRYVDCNDGGVPFIVATTTCNLSQVITDPDINKIKKSLIYKLDKSQFFLTVQLTFFICGGFAIGMLMSHKIFDGFSMVKFTESWSAVARNAKLPSPKFDSATYFPPEGVGSTDFIEEDVDTRIFKFSTAKTTNQVQILTAYIFSRIVSANGGIRPDLNKIYVVCQPVNLRTRVNPPMLKHHFGNVCWLSIAMLTAGASIIEVVQKLNESRKSLLDVSMPQLKDLHMKNATQALESDRAMGISSLCGFPLYETDFGWGKPVWVVVAGIPQRNVAIFTDTRNGDGIEVLVSLTKEDMENFEVDLEFLFSKSNL